MTVSRFPHLHQVLGDFFFPVKEADDPNHSAKKAQITTEEFTPELTAKLKDLKIDQTSGFSKWLSDPESDYAPSQVEVAYVDNTPVGWSGIGKTRGRQSRPIIGVFVLNSLRGQGLGERLIQAVLKTYKKTFDPQLDDPSILYSKYQWSKFKDLLEAAGLKPVPIGVDDYPLTSAVLADAPLPDLTDEEFWKRNFVRTQDRPGKRLGVELKHYLEFHRKEHPKGSPVTPDALCQMLRMTPKECGRIGLAIQYLIARKSIEKTKTPDLYRVR